MARLTLLKKIGGLLLIAFLGNLVVTAVVAAYLQGAADHPHLLNRAGRQRMVTVQMQKLVDRAARGEVSATDRMRLLETMSQYEEGLEAVGLDNVEGPFETLPDEVDGPAAAVASRWERLVPMLEDIARHSQDEPRFREALREGESGLAELLDLSDELVGALEAHAEKRREQTVLILWGANAGYFILLVVGLLVTRRYIIRPVHSIQQAFTQIGRGDFSARLPVVGSDELSVLARAYNEMSAQVERLIDEVQAEKRRFHGVVTHAFDGIIITDQNGAINYVNPAVEKWFGRTRDALIGQSIEVLVEADIAGFGEVRRCEGRAADGSVMSLECTHARYEVGDEIRDVFVLRDVTQRDKVTAKLMHLDRLVAVGNLASGVGHEVNNPLAFILPNIRYALEVFDDISDLFELEGQPAEGDFADRLRQAVERARLDTRIWNATDGLQDAVEGAERIRRIVGELRGLAKQRNASFQSVDIGEVVDTALRLLAGELRDNVQVHRDLEPVAAVAGIRPQLVEVFYSMLLNAGQAVGAARPGSGQINITVRQDDDFVVVEIEDNGEGISEEHRSQIFDPFFTTRSVGEGTGLGLTISHEIVQMHGGTIEVDSQPGQGTLVRTRLPTKQSISEGTPSAVEESGDSLQAGPN